MFRFTQINFTYQMCSITVCSVSILFKSKINEIDPYQSSRFLTYVNEWVRSVLQSFSQIMKDFFSEVSFEALVWPVTRVH